MSTTNSLAFPNMIDVARNKVSVVKDSASVVNRTRLLLLTEPSELYNSPDFGAGLKRYLFHYNTDNTVALIKDNITKQLLEYEPYVDATKTAFTVHTPDSDESAVQFNKLHMAVGLVTVFGESATVDIDNN